MESKSLVSVIIIFLNAERFIEEAIESVLQQTYTAWELLLVDDGSTDSSTQIARRYAERLPGRVHYLEHDGHANLGMSASRNLGIRHARGEFIAFLDADDVWLPHKLEEQVAILNAHPQAAMLYGRTQKWFGWTGDPEDIQKDALTELAVEPETLAQPPVLLTRFLKNEHVYPCTCSMLVRRATFDTVGMFEESFRGAYEDMVFHTKVFLNAPVFVSGRCWDRYRRHADNSWKRMVKAGLYDPLNPNPLRKTYLLWVERYLISRGVTAGEVWHTLQQELWPYRHPLLYRLSKSSKGFSLSAKEGLRRLARRVLPAAVHQWLRNQLRREII
jgi:glycosyltransferase involved in cell wall biosynthesis